MGKQLRAAVQLWWLGLWRSLQLQKCVVLFVLDSKGELGGKVFQCFLLNGLIFLGSVIWWRSALHPSVHWLMGATLLPVGGPLAVSAVERTLHLLYNVLWLIPAYFITMIVSCIWYQDVAKLAMDVQQHRSGVMTRRPSATGQGPGGPRGQQGSESALAGVAQELYRVILFIVFYGEVWLLGHMPYAGPVLSLLFLSWLYAYYCYDYKWSLAGVRLPDRLAYFQRRWAFFAGFGMPMAASTVLLPFYEGAAVLAILFPLFILIACDTDPDQGAGPLQQGMGSIPIFSIALWPTDRIVRLIFGMAPRRQAA